MLITAKNMAKKTPGKEPTSLVRLPAELLRMARVVSSYRGQELGEYLRELLGPPVSRDYGRIVRDPPARGE